MMWLFTRKVKSHIVISFMESVSRRQLKPHLFMPIDRQFSSPMMENNSSIVDLGQRMYAVIKNHALHSVVD